MGPSSDRFPFGGDLDDAKSSDPVVVGQNVFVVRQLLEQWLPGLKCLLASIDVRLGAVEKLAAAAVCRDAGRPEKGNPLGLPPDIEIQRLDERVCVLTDNIRKVDERLYALEHQDNQGCAKRLAERVRILEEKLNRITKAVS